MFKRILNCLYSGRRKVHSSFEFAFEFVFFVVGSDANSVGTTLEFIAFGMRS